MLIKLHEFILALSSDSPQVREAWAQLFAPWVMIPEQEHSARTRIELSLTMAAQVPSPPAGTPAYSQADLAVYPAGAGFIIHLPRLGQLFVDPRARTVNGAITTAVMDRYGAFEDINAISLAPLLRRQGRALIHAFAAAHHDRALLLIGPNASGKTTTGLSLLAEGWKLIANDSPILGEQEGRVAAFAYPGLLSAGTEALHRIPALRPALEDGTLAPRQNGWKITLAAEDHFESPWQEQAPVKALCLLELDRQGGHTAHRLTPLSPALALGRLLPHSVDRWDQEYLGFQIDLLTKMARQSPAYLLQLGPEVLTLPGMLERLLG